MCREKWALWPQFRKLPTQGRLFKGPICGLPSEENVKFGTDLSGWGCWVGSPRECPTLYMIWLWIDLGLWSSQLLPGPEHLLRVRAVQQVLLHIALDHRGHDGLGLWVSLRLRAFNFPAPSLSSSLSYWSSSYSHSDDQHLHTRLKYPHLPKTQYIQTIPHPLLLVYTHSLTIDTPSPKKSAVLICSPFLGTISGVVILKDKQARRLRIKYLMKVYEMFLYNLSRTQA